MYYIGVVGLGYWGPNLVRNLTENRLCNRVAICDNDAGNLEKIKLRYPAAVPYSDFDEMLADKNLHGVMIATPIMSHFELARKALLAGKHVFVEKPFTSSTAQAAELLSLAEARNLRLGVGHTFEYSPPVTKIRDIIDSGELGEIYYISSTRVNLGLHYKDLSVIWDLAPHDLSMIMYWLGEAPTEVLATGKDFVQKGICDVAFLNLKFNSGAIAHVQVSWLAPSKLRRTTIVGSAKMLVYDDTEHLEPVKIYDKGVNYKDPGSFGEFQLSYRTGDIVSPKVESFEPLQAEVNDFLVAILQERHPRADGEDGLRVVQVLEAAENSMNDSGRTQMIEDLSRVNS